MKHPMMLTVVVVVRFDWDCYYYCYQKMVPKIKMDF
jgi:hypothetical protein